MNKETQELAETLFLLRHSPSDVSQEDRGVIIRNSFYLGRALKCLLYDGVLLPETKVGEAANMMVDKSGMFKNIKPFVHLRNHAKDLAIRFNAKSEKDLRYCFNGVKLKVEVIGSTEPIKYDDNKDAYEEFARNYISMMVEPIPPQTEKEIPVVPYMNWSFDMNRFWDDLTAFFQNEFGKEVSITRIPWTAFSSKFEINRDSKLRVQGPASFL